MSLDVYLHEGDKEVFHSNITHNLNKMAMEAGIYKELWRPEEIDAVYAKDIIEPVLEGLKKLVTNPTYYKTLEADNGWGTYDQFLSWLMEYIGACSTYPNARIEVSR